MKKSWFLAAMLVLTACEEKIENNLTVVAQGFDAYNGKFMYSRLYANATSMDASDHAKFGGEIAGGAFTSPFRDVAKDVDFTMDYFVDRNNDGKCSPKLDLAWHYAVGKVPETMSKTVTSSEDYDWAACQRSFPYAVTGPSISGKYNVKVTVTGLDAYNGRNAVTTMPGGVTSTSVVTDGKVILSAQEAMDANPFNMGLWVDYNGDGICEAPEGTEHDGVFDVVADGGAPADITIAVSALSTNGTRCTGPKKGNVTLQDLGGAKFATSVGERLFIGVLDGANVQFRVSAVVPATGGVKFFVYNVIDVPASGTAPMTIHGYTDTDGNGHCNGTENTSNSWTYSVESRQDVGGINRDFAAIVFDAAACSTFP